VKPLYIIISKMVPYLILGAIDLALILVMARFVLGVPLSGGVGGIILVSLVYIVLSLALGLMVSNIAGSQIVALLLSAMVMMLPVLFFSGLLFPVENLPWVFRWISYVIPARWYIDAMRKMMIEGMALSGVFLEVGILVAEMLALIAASTKRFNDRLE
jgi:ABC-2 type transport system permease protein